VQTIRRPNDGTGTSSGQGEASSTVSWWHLWHDTASERAHAIGAHVAERHRFDGFVEAGHARKSPAGGVLADA
jgi:hypothetical protein